MEVRMAAYPVTFDVSRPERFDRTQVAIRIMILLVLAVAGASVTWAHGLLYLALPVLAAILISQRGAPRYISESGDNVTRWLRAIVGFYAYLALLTDRLPGSGSEGDELRFDVRAGGEPTAGQALLRIILAIPHFIVLWLLGIVAAILAIIAAILILVQESYSEAIYDYLRGYVRWQARVFAYLAALVDEYPPFAFDSGSEPAPAAGGEQTG
jgi:hypothetical protein